MNYTELSQAVTDYVAESTEPTFATNMPVFVRNAEQRIYNTVQFPALRRNVTGTTTQSNQYLACPNDFLSVFSMAVIDGTGTYEFLLNKDVNFIRQMYPSPATEGAPRYYSLFGPRLANPAELTFLLGPTPDAAYDVELHYFYLPESIVTAGTTWLGDNFESVLLYGTMVEAYTFLKGEADLIQLYDAKYKEALQMAKRLGDALERGDAYRDGQLKLPVT